jgi:hypothetical protein
MTVSKPSIFLNLWPAEAHELAKQARSTNALKLEPLVRKLQRTTGRRKRDCVNFILRQLEKAPRPGAWTDDEIGQVRELVLSLSVEDVARKIGRSPDAVRCICKRRGLRLRELRCDFFSIHSLAVQMHVRKREIYYWIEQGWLEASRIEQSNSVSYKISPDALQKCLRTHLDELQKRNIRSAAILSVFREYCYTPKHTIGEQLLQVREAKREQEAYESANAFQL